MSARLLANLRLYCPKDDQGRSRTECSAAQRKALRRALGLTSLRRSRHKVFIRRHDNQQRAGPVRDNDGGHKKLPPVSRHTGQPWLTVANQNPAAAATARPPIPAVAQAARRAI
jgi:hypothetical protein